MATLAALGCEYHASPSATAVPPSPFCTYQVGVQPSQSVTEPVKLNPMGTHFLLSHCGGYAKSLTVQLFGSDPAQPLAQGLPLQPTLPDDACLQLDSNPNAPSPAKLVVTADATLVGSLALQLSLN